MPFDDFDPSPILSLPDSAWPTNKQLAAIGSVAVVWNWLDLAIENIIATLTKGDEMLVQALTEDLSPDNRLKAIRRLVTTWEIVVKLDENHRQILQEIGKIVTEVKKFKTDCNRFIYGIWNRVDDETMFRWKHHTAPRNGDHGLYENFTKDDLVTFSVAVGQLVARANAAEVAARSLPPFPAPRSSSELPSIPGLSSLLAPYRRRED